MQNEPADAEARRQQGGMKFVNHFGQNGLTSIVLKQRGWEQTDDEAQADLVFSSVDRMREVYYAIPQKFTKKGFKISHFRTHGQITRKDMLAYHIREFAKLAKKNGVPLRFDFLPTTYFLPMEFSQIPKAGTYIVKPACMARGAKIFVATYPELALWFQNTFQGIYIRKKQLDMQSDDSSEYIFIVQQYISPPLLINGHKFDCRIYVLVRSFTPLDAWICDLAFARVASQSYDKERERLSALTNVSVNKSNNPEMLKIPLWQMNELLDMIHPRLFREACKKAESTIIRCLQCCCHSIIQEPACFELLGFDILFDEHFDNFVMEANASPSLSVDGDEDRALKMRMMHDLITTLYYEGAAKQVGCFRQIYFGTPGKAMQDWDQGALPWDRCLADKCCRIAQLIY